MKSQLADKVIIITDGETAIGADIAQAMARQGAKVVVGGSAQSLAGSVVHTICEQGLHATLYDGDLTQEAHALNCVQTAVDRYGHLDMLLASIEAYPSVMLTEGSPLANAEWTHTILQSTFLISHYALPYLRQTSGSLLTVYSELCTVAFLHHAPHEVAMKAWLNGLVQGFAREHDDAGVRANFICSRFPSMAWADREAAYRGQIEGAIASEFGINPQDVTNLCQFLASDTAHYVTGAVYTIRDDISASLGSFIPCQSNMPQDIHHGLASA
ncbi:MAG: SDR family NAD(P)-dependent oxidoreductase [Elainellaceae cyanobacterium]